jgi:excinuclease UvrABC ATPase subunit
MNIEIKGSRENNLRNISVSIPRNKLVVITGVSGSGKSSLAFDTIFAAAQREYLELMSSYARHSLPKISPPNVDVIEGLSPAIIVDQKPLGRNPRSTVGTVSEIYTYLRLLYSRLSKCGLNASDFSFNNPLGACSTCTGLGIELSPNIDCLINWDKSINSGAILHRTWKVGSRYWNIIRAINLFDLDKPLREFTKKELTTLIYSAPQKYQNQDAGYIQSFSFEGIVSRLLKRQRDSRGQASKGYDQSFFSPKTCSECKGSRLNARARKAIVDGKTIVDWVTMEIQHLLPYITSIKDPLADSILPYIKGMLGHLVDVGLGYLTLSRSVATLSGGEAQRVKLARQLGSSLIEMIYVFDEPTVGLHPREVDYLSQILRQLVMKGNTVIVVEHDRHIMVNADHIIDIGPGAGTFGGRIVAQGTPVEIMKSGSATGEYLSGKAIVHQKEIRRKFSDQMEVCNAKLHNLKNITVNIPKNVFTCITGVSGSGKSSMIDVLVNRYPEIIVVDQSPPGTTSRSNPATYTRLLDPIRKIFSDATGMSSSLFTFNSEGACQKCNGLGYVSIDLHFLGSFNQLCEDCDGKRFNEYTLSYTYREKTIADVLDLTIKDAYLFFDEPQIKSSLSLLIEVGLDYLRLGQPLNTLSGGEAQRIKLVSSLGQRGNIFVLDEPTKGLHFADIDRLLTALNRLVDDGNTVIVVEHNLDIVKNADWIIDLGPDGGAKGGQIVYEGTPELLLRQRLSHTARYLRELMLVDQN